MKALIDFYHQRKASIIFFTAFALLIGLIVQVASKSVNEVRQDALENRQCMLQLLIGGHYSDKPECRYPRGGYDSVVSELASMSDSHQNQYRVMACLLQLHVQNVPIEVEQIEACKRAEQPGGTIESGQSGVRPNPQPNAAPQPPSGGNGGDNGGNGNQPPQGLIPCIVSNNPTAYLNCIIGGN